jgi:sodium-dependent phosphate transporter
MALMAFGIGANDAANNWGTSVGSGAVSLRWALLIGGLMDWLGATMLGHSMISSFYFVPTTHAHS